MKKKLQTGIIRSCKLSCLLAALFCIFTMQAGAQTPYTITWQGLTGNTSAQNVPTGITVTQQYNGVVGSCNTSSNGGTTSYSAKLTAAPGYTFTITSIGGSAYASNAGSRNFSVKLDNTPFTGTGPVTSIGSSSSCSGNTALTPYSIPVAGQNVATGTTITITVLRAPGSAAGTGYSWTRSLTVTGIVTPVSSGTIATSAVTTSLCAGAAVSVPFTATGTFNSGNVFTAQLSNAAGSFTSPVNIGTLTGAGSGTISATIPTAATAGSAYRIRVVSANPSVTGTDNGANITIAPAVIPSVSVAAVPGTTVCAGTPVTFTATPTNGGSTPVFTWFKNNAVVGTSTNTFTDNSLDNSDDIFCVVTSNAACLSDQDDTSSSVVMVVNPMLVPSATISVGPNDTVCNGTNVTFTVVPVNGGSNPQYQWKKDGLDILGETNVTYTTATLADNEKISCVVTSNANCISPATANSDTVKMKINPLLTPSVTIAATPGNTICAGASVTFTATPVNDGTTPAYQWKKNNINVGTNSTTYTDNALVNGDVITVELTSNEACVTAATATSAGITMMVNPLLTPSVTIAGNPGNTICAGTPVTFTATPTNGGTTPVYQWEKNNVNVGTNSAIYTDNTLTNGDVITVQLTSNATCVTPATATSADFTMTVNPLLTPSVSIAASTSTTICAGTSVTFTATPTNGGTTPTYQWKKNNINVGTNSTTYTDNTIANGDIITVVMTSNAICATPAVVTSPGITMTVNPLLTPGVTIAANPGSTVCIGALVTFTATSVNGGSAPAYQWRKNGIDVGTNAATYTDNGLANNDVITVIMTSNATCISFATATSTPTVMTVDALVTPSLLLSLSTKDTVCDGTTIHFTTSATNAGGIPTYVWRKNGNIIPGATASDYISSSFVSGDNISVTMTSNAACASPATADDDTAIIVNPLLLPSLLIFASPDTTICAGTQVSFSVQTVNAGTSPQYQWKLNNVDMVGATSSIYMLNNLNAGDVVSCSLTSNATCATPATVNSTNKLNFKVGSTAAPVVTLAATPGTVINQGEEVTFTSSVQNSSASPIYKWFKNGLEISGATGTSFKTKDINVNDIIYLVVYSSDVCSMPDSGKSNSLQFTVTNSVSDIIAQNLEFELAPNPNNGSFVIKGNIGATANVRIEVIDNLGRLIYNERIVSVTPTFEKNINLNNIIPGMYYLRVSADEKSAVKPVVIK